ncbi:HAD family hydrolase [Nocardioides flavescens]|uniref:Haloacid dehalogenase n=1 Tax=Nocardioides flavescens TaxID=2691959 RepID=A0A6L7EPQ8_9ACTN|nr:HAD family hydrolase [Nocardioides flavescens]MXG89293.1 haloacid dehalogenase [Nocardioides flavescens]
MTASPAPGLVTFDLFSALTDSRRGAASVLARWAQARGWPTDPGTVYDDWDRRNKASQATLADWRPFAWHATEAWRATCAHLGLVGDVEQDARALLASVDTWPLWDDVRPGLDRLRDRVGSAWRIGILSNVDDDIARRTQAGGLVDPSELWTSERLAAYKPSPELYRRARVQAGDGPHVHVASSARDVRGALEAGISVVRLVRPGHVVDPEGPAPGVEASSVTDVADLLRE